MSKKLEQSKLDERLQYWRSKGKNEEWLKAYARGWNIAAKARKKLCTTT